MKAQSSFFTLIHNRKPLKCEKFLTEMEAVIPWATMMEEILPFYQEKERGRKKTELMLLLKMYFLQQWYGLSDPGIEEAIYDRNSFQKFLGIDPFAHNIPDETTVLHFRHMLEENEIQKKIFARIQQLLDQKGLIVKKGTIVDASIFAAPSSTKNKSKKRDPEMSSTQKNGQWYFGMKGHIGVDADTGVIHSVECTTAKESDIEHMEELLHGKEKAQFGDKGYSKKELKQKARKTGIYWGVLDKGQKNHPLSSSQKRQNRKLSSIRAKVEFPFRVLKCQWKYTKARFKGLKKNAAQLIMLFGLANIYLTRRQLMYTT